MSRFTLSGRWRAVVGAAAFALLASACSPPPEQQQLTQFFRASRARDNTTLAMMSAVEFRPREQGTVERFSITNIGQETRRPLGLKALLDAEVQAKQAEAEFSKRKMEYQTANLPRIEEVLKLERDPAARMSAAQQKVKAEWDKWREESGTHTKAVSDARANLISGIGPAEASLTQPGQPPFDAAKFEGDLVTKDVTIAAEVRTPQGETVNKDLTVTFARVSGTLDGAPREGRWIITRIAGM
ncbi:MAG: hypothetical protein AB7O32_01175 [Vicinamibacterales bacterium]